MLRLYRSSLWASVLGLIGEPEEEKIGFLKKLYLILSSFLAEILFALFVAFLLRQLYKKRDKILEGLKRFYKKQMKPYLDKIKKSIGLKRPLWMQRLFRRDKGYTDERESLIKVGGLGKKLISPLSDWLQRLFSRQPGWKDMTTNRDRIRYLYRYFILGCIKDGYHYKDILTPKETMKDLLSWDTQGEKTEHVEEIVSVYERARYGEQDIEDGEVEEAKGLTGFGKGRAL